MQRTWASRLKIAVKISIPVAIIAMCILLDQLTKNYIKNEFRFGERRFIIENFFYFTYTINTGAAWSFLADKPWSQVFFKVLTSIALIVFIAFLVYAIFKNYKWLMISLSLIIGGTIGNFIDRLFFSGVTDFIGVLFGSYPFPIFNLADSFLVVGLIMLIVYFLFIDSNALFKDVKKDAGQTEGQGDNGKEDISDK